MTDSGKGKILIFDREGRLQKPYRKFYKVNRETGLVEEVKRLEKTKRLPNPFRKVE